MYFMYVEQVPTGMQCDELEMEQCPKLAEGSFRFTFIEVAKVLGLYFGKLLAAPGVASMVRRPLAWLLSAVNWSGMGNLGSELHGILYLL